MMGLAASSHDGDVISVSRVSERGTGWVIAYDNLQDATIFNRAIFSDIKLVGVIKRVFKL